MGDFTRLTNPFMAQLPVGFHTGLIKQHIPRISSIVKWETVSQEEMPSDIPARLNHQETFIRDYDS